MTHAASYAPTDDRSSLNTDRAIGYFLAAVAPSAFWSLSVYSLATGLGFTPSLTLMTGLGLAIMTFLSVIYAALSSSSLPERA